MIRYDLLPLGLLVALAACHSDTVPQGQVIATVNGSEITRAEINAALPRQGSGNPAADTRIRSTVIDQLINQRLLTEDAKHQGLDKTQEYVLASRRADAALLTQLLSQHIVAGLRTPADQTVAAFVAANPARFSNRVVLKLDQIRVPAQGVDLATLKTIHNMDGVAAYLNARKLPFTRGQSALDSLVVDQAATQQLLALPAGEPFVTAQDGSLIISGILDKQSVPLSGDAAVKAAREVMASDAARAALAKYLEALRAQAAIRYQKGFEPSKPTGPASSGHATAG